VLATLALFFNGATLMALAFLFLGLIKPWWLLWWMDTQNRLKVIKVYGGIALGSYIIARILEHFI
jgi:hypothetical protein